MIDEGRMPTATETKTGFLKLGMTFLGSRFAAKVGKRAIKSITSKAKSFYKKSPFGKYFRGRKYKKLVNIRKNSEKALYEIFKGKGRYYLHEKYGLIYDLKRKRYLSRVEASKIWPKNDGFVSRELITLKKGQIIDRFGADTGKFFAPLGTPYSKRGIPRGYKKHTVYEVVKPFECETGKIAPAPQFGSKGGGIQFMTTKRARWLVDNGFLRIIN